PGIYTPASYVQNLRQFKLLANYLVQLSGETMATRLHTYHRTQADALQNNQPPLVLVRSAYISKLAIENPIKLVLASAAAGQTLDTVASRPVAHEHPPLDSPEELANWKLLAED